MRTLSRYYCETCGDESTTRVCSDCLREEEYRAIADELLHQYHIGIDVQARQQLEFPMKKCPLCDQYYGPYSMEKHLREDHSLPEEGESYRSGYRAGRADGETAGYKAGYADADPETF